MGRKWAIAAGVVLGVAGWGALSLQVVPVNGTEMAPTMVPGDWVLVGPGSPALGSVVALEDPAWPGRQVFRRVLGVGGSTIGIQEGAVDAGGDRLRIREMGRDEHTLTLAEDDGYLVQRRLLRDHHDVPAAEVPPGRLWLLGDNRIEALDSRWWGAVSTDRVDGVVWLRLGEPGAWRRRVAVRGRDGPWEKPTPTDPG